MDPNTTSKAPRKVKFQPKASAKREQKLVLPKVEKVENDIDEVKAEHLLRRYQETSSRVRPKPEKKDVPTEVAFGIGSSSRNLKSYGSAKPKSEGDTSQNAKKEYQEPWDYDSNYPTALPLRKPYSGNPELLDEEEFGDDPLTSEHVENETNTAEELSLLDNDEVTKLLCLQLPPMLPAIPHPTDSGNNPSSSMDPSNNSQKLSTVSLPAGPIGKMLVYKSGAVKLKIGDILYNVDDGVKCSFAQEVAGVNVGKKCSFSLGEINTRAVASLDVDSMLDNLSV